MASILKSKLLWIFTAIIALILIGIVSLQAAPENGAVLDFVTAYVDGNNGINRIADPQDIVLSPDGNYVYVASREEDSVTVLSRNATDGRLTFVEVERHNNNGVSGLEGTTGLAIAPDGAHLYAMGTHSTAIVVFDRDNATGELTYDQNRKNHIEGVDWLKNANHIVISPNGKHVYVGSSWFSEIALFNRNLSNGRLTFVDVVANDRVDAMVLSPDGDHFYVATAGDIRHYSRDNATGTLTAQAFHVEHPYLSLAFAPDGNQLYVGTYLSQIIDHFDVSSADGTLTNAADHTPANAPLAFMDIAVSPDGQFVYGITENDLHVFSRNSGSGALTFAEYHRSGVDGVFGIAYVSYLTVSPDSKHVYVTSTKDVSGNFGDDAIAVFSRTNLTQP